MDIDDFSRKWGQMEQKQASLEEAVDKHHVTTNKKLDRIIDKLTDMNGNVRDAHTRIDNMSTDVEEAKENGEDWRSTKGAAKWLIGGGILAGGTSGFSLGKWLSFLWGAGS